MRRRYVQVTGADGKSELVDATDWKRPPRKAPMIMCDLKPYVPVAGPEALKIINRDPEAKLISGRKDHREFLRRNDFIEVGNEMKPFVEHGGKTRQNWNNWNNREVNGVPTTPADGEWQEPDIGRLSKK